MKKAAPIKLLKEPALKLYVLAARLYFGKINRQFNYSRFNHPLFLTAYLTMYKIVARPRILAQLEAREARENREAQKWEERAAKQGILPPPQFL